MGDLDRLIAAVEAGECPDFCPMWHGEGLCVEAEGAFAGSLDAALRLHEALLPGVRWYVGADEDGWPNEFGAVLYSVPKSVATASTPARAWLLALLRALSAQRETKNE